MNNRQKMKIFSLIINTLIYSKSKHKINKFFLRRIVLVYFDINPYEDPDLLNEIWEEMYKQQLLMFDDLFLAILVLGNNYSPKYLF